MRIPKRLKTLRFRLTLMYVVIFGLVQTTLSLVINIARDRQLERDFNALMLQRAEGIAGALKSRPELLYDPAPADLLAEILNQFVSGGFFCQTRPEEGTREPIRSSNLGVVELPLSARSEDARRRREPVFEDLAGETIAHLTGGSQIDLRLLTLYLDPPGGRAYFLQLGRSLQPLEQSIADFNHMVLLFLFLSLGAASVASWLLIKHAFAPVGDIAREARRITSRRLDVRLEVPRGEDELSELVLVFNEMLDRLEVSFKAQERLLGDVSHELKTPISVLRGQAQQLERRQATIEDCRRFARDVRQEMDHMNDIVDSFLALTRMEVELRKAARTEVALNDLVLDALRHCLEVARERKLRLVPRLPLCESPEDREPVVEGDANLLRIMLENLIRNAKKYSSPGGVVEIEVQTHASEVTVHVRDRGPGIPPELLGRVFERAYRVPREGTREGGVGLGLAIAQSIAHLHAGTITATNRPEGGCEFTVRLPVSAADEAGSPSEAHA